VASTLCMGATESLRDSTARTRKPPAGRPPPRSARTRAPSPAGDARAERVLQSRADITCLIRV
jgi:hypothetical protein